MWQSRKHDRPRLMKASHDMLSYESSQWRKENLAYKRDSNLVLINLYTEFTSEVKGFPQQYHGWNIQYKLISITCLYKAAKKTFAIIQVVKFYKMIWKVTFACLHTLPPWSISEQMLYWAVWPRSSRKFPEQAARTSSLSVGGEDKAIGWRSGLWLATGWARSSRCNVQYAVPGQVLQPGKQERLFRLSSQGQPTCCPLWYSWGHSDVLWQRSGWVRHYAEQLDLWQPLFQDFLTWCLYLYLDFFFEGRKTCTGSALLSKAWIWIWKYTENNTEIKTTQLM